MPTLLDRTRMALRELKKVNNYYLNYNASRTQGYGAKPWIGRDNYREEIDALQVAVKSKDEIRCRDVLPLAIDALRDAASKMDWLSTVGRLERLANTIAAEIGQPTMKVNHDDTLSMVQIENDDDVYEALQKASSIRFRF
jgi:hypothetical protein